MERSRRGGGGWTVRQREWRWCELVRVGAGGDRGVEPKLLHGDGGWGSEGGRCSSKEVRRGRSETPLNCSSLHFLSRRS